MVQGRKLVHIPPLKRAALSARTVVVLFVAAVYLGLRPAGEKNPAVLCCLALALVYSLGKLWLDLEERPTAEWWYLWMAVDGVGAGLLVYLTGGGASRFTSLYFLGVVFYAARCGPPAGILCAVFSSLSLGAAMVFASSADLLGKWVVHTGLLLCVGWLTGSLAEEERKLRLAYERLAVTDDLTGLFNQRYLHRCTEELMSRARQCAQPVSLLFVDVDEFKAVNDSFGHAVGDAVLREMSIVLRTAVRADDVVFRYGGEEFVVLLYGAGEDEAAAVAERIKRLVGGREFGQGDAVRLRLSVSVGVATATTGEGVSSLLRRADLAMYAAKRDEAWPRG